MKWSLNCRKENVSKKYAVSKHITMVYLMGIGMLTVCLLFFIYMLRYTTPDALVGLYAFISICAVGILLGLKVLLFDTPAYRFSISMSGVTMYIRHNKYYIPWNEVAEYDIVLTPISYQNTSQLNWIYFSKRHLTKKEIRSFNATVLKSRGDFACLQCGSKIYSEIRQFIPNEIRNEFDTSFSILNEKMTKEERRVNK